MKKFLAILMCAVLVLGAMAGCSEKKESAGQVNVPGATDQAGEGVNTPIAAGMLVLNANGAINISYDADGLVLNVEGVDDNGQTLAVEYVDFLGKSCSDAVCDLIANSIHNGFMTAEENYVVIKLAAGSVLPDANFVEDIQMDAQQAMEAAGCTAQLVVLTLDNLDDEGYIDLDSAKKLICAYMAVESYDVLDGAAEHSEGLYNFRVTAGERVEELIVDGVTGDVYEGTLDDARFEDDLQDEEIDTADPTDEVMVETQPVATEVHVEEPVEDPVIPEEIVE